LLNRDFQNKTGGCDAVEFPSCRVIFTALAFFGFLNIYCLRVNLSVALVAMVNSTEEPKNFTPGELDNCDRPIEEKKKKGEEVNLLKLKLCCSMIAIIMMVCKRLMVRPKAE